MVEARTDEVVTREELTWLLGERQSPVVSLFFPTDRVAVEPEQNSLHLKNLLGTARERLGQLGMRSVEVDKLLEPARNLLDDHELWRHQLDGFALFCGPDFFRFYRVPFEVEELVVVNDRAHIKPLLPALSSDGHFYLLALSQNAVRLFRATRFTIDELDLEELDIPHNLAEALQYDDLQKPDSKEHPTTPRNDNLGQRHNFHGHGPGGQDNAKNEILRFFQGLDAGISKLLATENAPLVLAGVDYLHPLYRQASDYRHITEKGVEGNPDRQSPAQLHEQAWPIVQPLFREGLREAKDKYGMLEPRAMASCDLEDVLRNAFMGRVETLFTRKGHEVWGIFEPTEDRIEVHDEEQPGDSDLLDAACREVLTHNGDVYVVEGPDMPCEKALAAVYRY